MSFDSSRTAVVAVHFQNDIVGPDGAFAGFFRAEVERTGVIDSAARLLGGARTAGATVLYTPVAWKPGYADRNANSPLLGMVAQTQCLQNGSTGAAITDEVIPRDSDQVVTHKRVGGSSDSGLDATLKAAGVDTVVFCGVATNA